MRVTEAQRKNFHLKYKRGAVNECWPWLAAKNHLGYGKVGINNKTIGAHRLSKYIFCGPFDESLFVLHSCDNPICVNPFHLRVGTQQDNLDDMKLRGRKKHWARSVCQRGHPFDEGVIRDGVFKATACRTCRVARQQRKREKYWIIRGGIGRGAPKKLDNT